MSKTKEIKTLADLTPDPANARKHNPRNVGMLVDSLHQVGAARSIVVDENGVVLAGNATIEAAAEAGIHKVRSVEADGNEIIAVVRRGLTKEQKTKLALYDNRVAELAEWNPDSLAELVDTDVLAGMFSDKELAEILTQTGVEPKDAEPQIDKAEELRQKWGTETGQLWVIGNHRLLVGDATNKADVGRVCGNNQIDMVFADPPYGVSCVKKSNRLQELGYRQFRGDDSTELAVAAYLLHRNIAPVQVWWGANHYADALPPSRCWLVWDKDHAGMDFGDGEMAWTNVDAPIRIFRHAWSGNDRDSERGELRLHASQKPAALAAWCYQLLGKTGQVVFDPFLGVGAGMIAAENESRSCYAMEIDAGFAACSLERMHNAFPHLKIEKAEQARAA